METMKTRHNFPALSPLHLSKWSGVVRGSSLLKLLGCLKEQGCLDWSAAEDDGDSHLSLQSHSARSRHRKLWMSACRPQASCLLCLFCDRRSYRRFHKWLRLPADSIQFPCQHFGGGFRNCLHMVTIPALGCLHGELR